MTRQDTPLTGEHLGDLVSVSPAGAEENRFKNRPNIYLSDQSHRQDISMRTKRPSFHRFVKLAALFLFVGTVQGAVPLQSKFFVCPLQQ